MIRLATAKRRPEVEQVAAAEDGERDTARSPGRGRRMRLFAYGLVPALVMLLAVGAGYVKWVDSSVRDAHVAAVDSMQVASTSTVKMLSYHPDTVEADLAAACDRLTGPLRDSYTQLTHDVVIPGARQQHIAALATVPGAASVSASENHSVVLVFVDQTITVAGGAPSNTASTVKVTLDKIGDQWLVSGFDPV
jgi:Mce-associated membrane protein